MAYAPQFYLVWAGSARHSLAVEYAYRFRQEYKDGVYWVNAAENWQREFARLAGNMGMPADDVPEADRAKRLAVALADFLNTRSDALLILDNVEDPRDLRLPLNDVASLVISEMKCRLLFTTRKRYADLPFEAIEVRVLPRDAAMQLLLSRRQEVLETSHPEHIWGQIICKTLGYLPLALEIAAALPGTLREHLAKRLSRKVVKGRCNRNDR